MVSRTLDDRSIYNVMTMLLISKNFHQVCIFRLGWKDENANKTWDIDAPLYNEEKEINQKNT